jgi:wyosine [tRNA(Phe)-imidazoG37] synthetase (radical SAM superfamily)
MAIVDDSRSPVEDESRNQSTPTFGPVPSRRFGRSLGLNTIPAGTCSYSCIYCQVGRTSHLTTTRTAHADPGFLLADVRHVLTGLSGRGEAVDYLTFVTDGEPTLDSRLGDQIASLKPLGVPVAVITNASLLSRDAVRGALAAADRVSVKVDSVKHGTWRRINRPHGDLRLEDVLDGVLQFSREFAGEFDTETMLVRGVNDTPDDLAPLAAYLGLVQPRCAYLAAPVRPPAEEGVEAPDETALVRAYETIAHAVARVELLTGYEGDAFSSAGDARADLLAITAVHPMRLDQVERLLERAGAAWDVVEWLIRQEKLREVVFNGQRFIIRRSSRP